MAEGFEDYFERIRAALPCLALGEARVAVVAKPALEDFVLLVALARPGDVRAVAVDAVFKISAD